VTIPGELRHRHGIVEGDEVDVVEDGNAHHKTPIDQPRPTVNCE
jgi:bifunctional DNA-binding transcriptional regulator/antitoxin component of YhaV-PrlF toxin-antitoxin module